MRTRISTLDCEVTSGAIVRSMTLCNMRHGMLLITSLIVSGLLSGCESHFDRFERFYRPVATLEGAPQPGAAPPKLIYSLDPGRDEGRLQQDGYVLIGTTSFNGSPDLSYADRAAVAQGQKVGAVVVLLRAHSHNTLTTCCWLDDSVQASSGGGVAYFASYWAKSGSLHH